MLTMSSKYTKERLDGEARYAVGSLERKPGQRKPKVLGWSIEILHTGKVSLVVEAERPESREVFTVRVAL